MKLGMVPAFFVFVGVAGCTAAGFAPEGSLAYREGYRYGCFEGYEAAGRTNFYELRVNPPEYADSPDWEPAWEEGYRKCFDRAISTTSGEGGG